MTDEQTTGEVPVVREPSTRTLPRVGGTSVPAPPAAGEAVTYRPAERDRDAGPVRTAPPTRPAARVPSPPLAATAAGRTRKTGARRARLRLTRVDPWSALKVGLVFSAFLFVVWMVAVIVLYAILQGAGVFSSVNDTLSNVLSEHINFSGAVIVGGAAVIGALGVVIVTALGTIIAFAYNLTASLLGGLDVTLTESE